MSKKGYISTCPTDLIAGSSDLIFGFEYNLTNQLKKTTYEGHFAHATDHLQQ